MSIDLLLAMQVCDAPSAQTMFVYAKQLGAAQGVRLRAPPPRAYDLLWAWLQRLRVGGLCGCRQLLARGCGGIATQPSMLAYPGLTLHGQPLFGKLFCLHCPHA
jgi:hypothetical protein